MADDGYGRCCIGIRVHVVGDKMSKIIAAVLSVFVVLVVAGSVLAPVIQESYESGEAIKITNEGANDILLTKLTSGYGLNMSVSYSGDDVTITNGSDTITTYADPQIILATDKAAVFFNEKGDCVCVWNDGEKTNRRVLDGDFTAVIADDKLTIDDGTSTDLPLPAAYMFMPSSNGQYGSFSDGELNRYDKDPVIAVGDFAGVAAYNQYTSTVDLNEHVITTDGVITSVIWDAIEEQEESDPEEFNPQIIDFDPISINPVDPEPDASIMAVPTPTYTDGDWGYNLSNNGRYAFIASYSGSGGDVVVPSTLGDKPVYQVGLGGIQQYVIDYSVHVDTLTIPAIDTISAYAFYGCDIDTVILPENIKLDGSCFMNSTLKGTLIIPPGVQKLANDRSNQFYGCSGLDSLIYMSDVFTPYNGFKDTGIKEVLNLSSLNINTTTFGLNADEVRTDIEASSYIAPYDLSVSAGSGSSPYNSILNTTLLIVIASVLIAAVGIFLIRKD